MGWVWDGMGWDLCAGLFYEHRFAMLINVRKKNNLSRNTKTLVVIPRQDTKKNVRKKKTISHNTKTLVVISRHETK